MSNFDGLRQALDSGSGYLFLPKRPVRKSFRFQRRASPNLLKRDESGGSDSNRIDYSRTPRIGLAS